MEWMEKLAELRRERGLTQDELAREVGVTRQAVSKWERGVIAPSTVNLIALGRLYGIPLDELVNGEASPGEHAAVAVAEKPEAGPPRKKAGPLKIMGIAAAAVLVLLMAAASVITIVSAILKEPAPSKDGVTIIDQDDLRVEEIDLTEVIDMTGNSGIIITHDGVTISDEEPEDKIKVVWMDELEGEEIDLTEVIDSTDGTTNIEP